MEKSVLIAGFGGQGILFMGDLLTHTAMLSGKEVTSLPSYGVEKIGGYAKCTVIISDEMIGSPIAEKFDILIAMNNWAIKKFIRQVVQDGYLFYDSTIVNTEINCNCSIINIPASDIVLNEGVQIGANMVMLGCLVAKTNLIDLDTLYKVLKMRTPSHRKDSFKINQKLILKGYNYCENKKG
ncbi:MAG: 2-oxoacid:acceptor oxidoreductase family protein [Thermodesulfovibrionales bacterium]|nr:2-oxoacid:acceptor oxidoreductase family protein [Thermodesulfovibrionales bacterium]